MLRQGFRADPVEYFEDPFILTMTRPGHLLHHLLRLPANGGTRTALRPEGDGSRADEVQGNEFADVAQRVSAAGAVSQNLGPGVHAAAEGRNWGYQFYKKGGLVEQWDWRLAGRSAADVSGAPGCWERGLGEPTTSLSGVRTGSYLTRALSSNRVFRKPGLKLRIAEAAIPEFPSSQEPRPQVRSLPQGTGHERRPRTFYQEGRG